MAEIRLENVTVTFDPQRGPKFLSSKGVRNYMSEFADQDFVSRVRETEREHDTLRGDGTVVALDGIDLTVPDGKTISVVGPSGCGKSTLLRVVAGLHEPDEGAIYFDGQDMADIKPKDRGIGMVFQSYALYPHMKGEGNLGFFFKVRNRPDEEMRERIRITSEIMGIGFEQLLSRKPGTLSGGQQQRVAIGRCIVRDPTIFLFDEPLSNLDAKLRASTRVEIRRLLQRFAITAIYVTHDQVEAITLADTIVVMKDGKIQQQGTYDEITRAPNTAFVASFLGMPPMNLLRDWVVTPEGTLQSAYGTIPVPSAYRGQVQPDQKVILGFHADDASIVPQGDAGDWTGPKLDAEVLNTEPNFARHYQIVNVQAAELIFGVQAPMDLRANTGWMVEVLIPEDTAYLFDQESDQRITPA